MIVWLMLTAGQWPFRRVNVMCDDLDSLTLILSKYRSFFRVSSAETDWEIGSRWIQINFNLRRFLPCMCVPYEVKKNASNMEVVSVLLWPGIGARTVRHVSLKFCIGSLLLELSDSFHFFPHCSTTPSLHATINEFFYVSRLNGFTDYFEVRRH
jgi:hypothetical protein